MTSYRLTHLKQLESESIHIIREVAAEFSNPVMLYSVGKDSSWGEMASQQIEPVRVRRSSRYARLCLRKLIRIGFNLYRVWNRPIRSVG